MKRMQSLPQLLADWVFFALASIGFVMHWLPSWM